MVDVDRKTQREAGSREEPREAGQKGERPAADAGRACSVAFCPIGLAISAVQPMKPDVVEHLLLAGRELFLAAKAVLDARADELRDERAPAVLEKIDIA